MFIGEKKSIYNWSRVVQTHAAQGSTVYLLHTAPAPSLIHKTGISNLDSYNHIVTGPFASDFILLSNPSSTLAAIVLENINMIMSILCLKCYNAFLLLLE